MATSYPCFSTNPTSAEQVQLNYFSTNFYLPSRTILKESHVLDLEFMREQSLSKSNAEKLKEINQNLLPADSLVRYEKAWSNFVDWCSKEEFQNPDKVKPTEGTTIMIDEGSFENASLRRASD